MKTKPIMISSSIFLGILGISLTFIPDENGLGRDHADDLATPVKLKPKKVKVAQQNIAG